MKSLPYFEAEHLSPYGRIVSGWERKGRNVQYTAVIPPNSTATLYQPDGKIVNLDAGTHTFRYNLVFE